MAEKLPQVSGRQAAQAFARSGWKIRKTEPHIILAKEGVLYNLSVPDHRELKKGTLRSLIRKAGLTIAEFVGFLT